MEITFKRGLRDGIMNESGISECRNICVTLNDPVLTTTEITDDTTI